MVDQSIVVFVVSLLVGGLGLYVGGKLIAGHGDYGHAVVTAGIGALVWAVVDAFLGWLPVVGPILTLLAYVAVIRWRYRGGWLTAAGVALVAWIASLVVLALLAELGVVGYSALGVPSA